MSETTIPVRVAVRVRPLSLKESSNGCLSSVEVVPGRPQIVCKGGLEKVGFYCSININHRLTSY